MGRRCRLIKRSRLFSSHDCFISAYRAGDALGKSVPTKARAQLLVVKLDESHKATLDSVLSNLTKYNIKSQNYTGDSVEVVYEVLEALSPESINKINNAQEVKSARLINYTGNR